MGKLKIKSQRELKSISARIRDKGKKVVAVSGSFDVLHAGHIDFLKEAKEHGDILFVLLNSNKSIKLYKGPNRPIIQQKQRAKMLVALECVDYVTLFNEINPKKLLAKLRPDVFFQGSEWGKNCVERKIVEEYGGQIKTFSGIKTFSTTDLIKKMKQDQNINGVKAVFLDRDGTININKPEYIHEKKDFKFAPGVIKGLKKLQNKSYKLIVITNQSGVARGFFSDKELKSFHDYMLEKLRGNGVEIDKVYYCPHHPDYDGECNCRKPKPGMLLKAVKELGISLNKSWLIGDSPRDIVMAREANVASIKLKGGMPKELKLEPNYYANNFLVAVDYIIDKQ